MVPRGLSCVSCWVVHGSLQWALWMRSLPFGEPAPLVDNELGALRQLPAQTVALRRAWDSKSKSSGDVVA